MGTKLLDKKTLHLITERVDRHELEYMAYTGQYEHVHNLFCRIPVSEWDRYANKYILNQVVWGGISKMRQLLSVHADQAATTQKMFIEDVVLFFRTVCDENNNYPREYFQTLLFWSSELMELSLYSEAMRHIRAALANGCNKFPDLLLQFQSRLARVAADQGNIEIARDMLTEVASRPYLIPDRNLIPEILFDLGIAALMSGEVNYYKHLQFLGLRYFYTGLEQRERFVEQIIKTFRHGYKVLLHKKVSMPDKLLFLLQWIFFRLPETPRIPFLNLRRFFRFPLLSIVYLANYGRDEQALRLECPSREIEPAVNGNGVPPQKRRRFLRRRRDHLITRAMGGIGDLLMMTPGIHALKQKYPQENIVLAIPKRYFSVFQNNPDITLVDVENEEVNPARFRRWFNFTDCPASRVESRTAPRVKKSRVEIFARALGIKGLHLLKMNKKPHYFISEDEKVFREKFWRSHQLHGRTVIGVQLQADETYRNYPHTERLVMALARQYTVLVFDSRPISGLDDPNVIKIDRYSIRQAFAIASGCTMIVAPDSAFVHLAGALSLPAVALFGPIDGKIRTKHYPTVEFLDARQQLGCVACWRNEAIPCKLTNMRQSVCMGDIPVGLVVKKVQEKIGQPLPQPDKTIRTNYE